MYCNNCGNNMSETDTFCIKCGTPVKPPTPSYQQPSMASYQQPPMAPSYAPSGYGQPAAVEDRGVYGRFGGLMIYGGLFLILFLVGIVLSEHFLKLQNFRIMGLQLVTALPLAFAVGLTVKTKGVDLSIAAMFSLTMGIMLSTDSIGLGILIAVLACIIVGTINAVGIHFLKLPGLLVTIVTYLIVSYVSGLLLRNGAMRPMRIAPGWLYVTVLIAALVAVAIALVSSIRKNHRNKFGAMLLVYAGSGILAVLYSIAFTIRVQAVTYNNASLINMILLIALFLSITRFFKSKALGVAFAIIPSIVWVISTNIMNLLNTPGYVQQIIMLLFILIMIFLVFYRGRAQLIGQSLDRMYRAKSWMVIIPLLLLLVSGVIIAILVSIPPKPNLARLYYTLAGVTFEVILLAVTIALSITYALIKPKGSTIV